MTLDKFFFIVSHSRMNSATPFAITDPGQSPSAAQASFDPLYQQISKLLTRELSLGTWGPGQMIPSEMELSQRYRVSQGTMRKAIDSLAAAQLVVRRQGRGTFVASHDTGPEQFRFLRLRRNQGAEPLAPHSEILQCSRERASSEMARQLQIKAADWLVFIRRRLSVDGRGAVIDDIWLPAQRFKGLNAERLAAHSGPLYSLFEVVYGVKTVRASEKLRAINAPAAIANLLDIESGRPVLLVDRLSLGYEDRPVEVRRGYYHTEHMHYSSELV